MVPAKCTGWADGHGSFESGRDRNVMCVLLRLKCPLWGMTLLWVNGGQCFSSLTNILEYYIKLFLSHQNGY